MKGIVEAAKKAGVELKAADAAAGDGDDNNKEAGKLFASDNNGAGAANADAAQKAAAAAQKAAAAAQKAAAAAGKAVSAVSGDQILKAIVDAAGTAGGKAAKDATNAVEAAIGGGGDGDAAADFDAGKMKNEQIAAAIVLRGLAKGGKFANANADDKVQVKAAVKSAVEWLKEMHTAAEATVKAGGEGGSDLICECCCCCCGEGC